VYQAFTRAQQNRFTTAATCKKSFDTTMNSKMTVTRAEDNVKALEAQLAEIQAELDASRQRVSILKDDLGEQNEAQRAALDRGRCVRKLTREVAGHGSDGQGAGDVRRQEQALCRGWRVNDGSLHQVGEPLWKQPWPRSYM
jgi:ATP/maltotriose-dependent transcriptional regulator MalT